MRTRSATASEIERGLQWTCFHKVKWNIRAVSGWLTVWVLGVCEVELDGRRGRSFRLSADGTGKGQNQTTEGQYRQGLERSSGVIPRLKAE